MNSMDKTRKFLESIGLPGGDAYDLPTSEKRFKDGGIRKLRRWSSWLISGRRI